MMITMIYDLASQEILIIIMINICIMINYPHEDLHDLDNPHEDHYDL